MSIHFCLSVIDSFNRHSYDFDSISTECQIPRQVIEEHVHFFIKFSSIFSFGFTLPFRSYPIPFPIHDGEMYDKMMNILDQLEKKVKVSKARKKERIDHRFIPIPATMKNNTYLYDHRNKLDGLPEYHLVGIRYLQVHGICTLQYFTTEFMDVKKYRADTSMKILTSSAVFRFVEIYNPTTRLNCVVLRDNAQNDDNSLLKKWCYTKMCGETTGRTKPHVDETSSASRVVDLNSDSRVVLMKRIIEEGRWEGTFRMTRLTNDLETMIVMNKHYFRYNESVKLYAHCLHNYLGKAKYQMLLGVPERDSTGEYDPTKINDLLPSISLLEQQRLSMITETGIHEQYIRLCSELTRNLDTFPNFWVLMIDSVDLQVNLTVSHEKGKIFGIAGKTYNINQVFTHPIFGRLDAVKDLSRKATVGLLCHTSNHFAVPIACDTCISETTDTIVQLLRNCIQLCKQEKLNIQLLNSDGANYTAVKRVANEFGIAAANCVCHLGKNCRNPLLDDDRTILVPVHQVNILTVSKFIEPTKCVQEGVNFITIIIVVDRPVCLEVFVPQGPKMRRLFCGNFSVDSCDIHFDNEFESDYTYSNKERTISVSIYSLVKAFDQLIFQSSAELSIDCIGFIVQQVSMDTVRATFEDTDHGYLVQQCISWEGMHCVDKMNESFMSEITSDKYLSLLKEYFPQFPGLLKYLTIAHNIYHPSASECDIGVVLKKLQLAMTDLKTIRGLTTNFKGKFGMTDATYSSLELNISACQHITQYMKDHNLSEFSTRLLLTNRLEGLFGRC